MSMMDQLIGGVMAQTLAEARGYHIDSLKKQNAQLANRLDAISGVLEVHRCLSRPTMTVGECVREKLCACSCELLIVPEGFASPNSCKGE